MQTTPVGRGRGYASRNRDLRKPQSLIVSDDGQTRNATAQSPPGLAADTSQSPPTNVVTQPYASPPLSNNGNKKSSLTPPAASNMNKIMLGTANQSGKQLPSSIGSKITYQDFKNYEETENLDENIQSVLYIDEKYSYLIQQVNVLSESDDGILTNQKLKHIEGVLSKECSQPQTLRNAMEALASAAISDLNMTAKVSKMMCSITFSRIQLHQLRLYNVFISALRDKIDGLELTLDGADQYLVNASTLLTEIYTESKLLEPEELNVLANLILQVFIGLLECNTPLSLRSLNVQLMQYGRTLYSAVSEKLDGISLLVRKQIISRQPPPFPCRIWLSLLSDQCLYRFQPLPVYLQDFYAKHLDDSNQENEPKSCRYSGKFSANNDLSTKKHPSRVRNNNKNYDNIPKEYQKSDSNDRWSVNGEKPVKNSHSDNAYDEKNSFEGSAVEYYSSDAINDHMNVENPQTLHERKPRPILGAGARIAQQQSRPECDNQFSEPPPSVVSYNHTFNDSSIEIPEFCPSVPPPNFIPSSGKVITSAGQDSGDFWNYPPPKITATNVNKKLEMPSQGVSSLSSRHDLNSWRQQNNEDNDEQFNINGMNNVHAIENLEILTHPETLEDCQINNLEESIEQLQMKDEKFGGETGVSFWGKKRVEEDDKNWIKNSSKQSQSEKKKDANWIKKENDEKESNWRRRGSDEKNWDGKKQNWSSNKKLNEIAPQEIVENRTNRVRTDSGLKTDDDDERKSTGRRDSRGSGRGPKRDFMEVPRKASYWTHDDRCDKDYDD